MLYRNKLFKSMVLSLTFVAAANAESITYLFTGNVAVLPAPVVPFAVSPGFQSLGISTGDAVSGSFSYLTGGTDGSPLATIGSFTQQSEIYATEG